MLVDVFEVLIEKITWIFFFSSRIRHTRCGRDWSSDVCSSDLEEPAALLRRPARGPEHGPRQVARLRVRLEVSLEDQVHAIGLHAAPPLASAARSRLLPRWSWLFTVLIEMPRMRASSP